MPCSKLFSVKYWMIEDSCTISSDMMSRMVCASYANPAKIAKSESVSLCSSVWNAFGFFVKIFLLFLNRFECFNNLETLFRFGSRHLSLTYPLNCLVVNYTPPRCICQLLLASVTVLFNFQIVRMHVAFGRVRRKSRITRKIIHLPIAFVFAFCPFFPTERKIGSL